MRAANGPTVSQEGARGAIRRPSRQATPRRRPCPRNNSMRSTSSVGVRASTATARASSRRLYIAASWAACTRRRRRSPTSTPWRHWARCLTRSTSRRATCARSLRPGCRGASTASASWPPPGGPRVHPSPQAQGDGERDHTFAQRVPYRYGRQHVQKSEIGAREREREPPNTPPRQ